MSIYRLMGISDLEVITNQDIRIIEDYNLDENTTRTPRQLLLKGQKIVEDMAQKLDGFIYVQQKWYNESIYYLTTAAILGQMEAPFFLSCIYEKAGVLVKNRKLGSLWLAIGYELGDQRALETVKNEGIIFEDIIQRAAKAYADLIKQKTIIYRADVAVSLEQIRIAINAWGNKSTDICKECEYKSPFISLVYHPVKFTRNCGALVKMIQESYDQNLCDHEVAEWAKFQNRQTGSYKDNYKITKEVSMNRLRTPNNLFTEGDIEIAVGSEIAEMTENPLLFEQTLYTLGIWYLEAAAVLGHRGAPFLLSFIYGNSASEKIKNEKLSKIWLAIWHELGGDYTFIREEYLVKPLESSELEFDEKTRNIAKAYASFMRVAAKIHPGGCAVSLEQIEEATLAWNTIKAEKMLNLKSHTLEFINDEGTGAVAASVQAASLGELPKC